MLSKMRTDSIVVEEYTAVHTRKRESSDVDSTLRLTYKEAQFNGKFKINLLRSNFQYIVLGPVEGDAAVREKLKIRIGFWIFDFIVLK